MQLLSNRTGKIGKNTRTD